LSLVDALKTSGNPINAYINVNSTIIKTKCTNVLGKNKK